MPSDRTCVEKQVFSQGYGLMIAALPLFRGRRRCVVRKIIETWSARPCRNVAPPDWERDMSLSQEQGV